MDYDIILRKWPVVFIESTIRGNAGKAHYTDPGNEVSFPYAIPHSLIQVPNPHVVSYPSVVNLAND